MRIDKYLKISRIIKRRTVAADACNAGHVSVNGKNVKASYDLKLGDQITVRFGERTFSCKVTDMPEHAGKNEAHLLYEVL